MCLRVCLFLSLCLSLCVREERGGKGRERRAKRRPPSETKMSQFLAVHRCLIPFSYCSHRLSVFDSLSTDDGACSSVAGRSARPRARRWQRSWTASSTRRRRRRSTTAWPPSSRGSSPTSTPISTACRCNRSSSPRSARHHVTRCTCGRDPSRRRERLQRKRTRKTLRRKTSANCSKSSISGHGDRVAGATRAAGCLRDEVWLVLSRVGWRDGCSVPRRKMSIDCSVGISAR